MKVYNTICNSTTDRQNAAHTLAGRVDLMLVVGGRNSANTTRLVTLSREQGKPTYHIELADEIQQEWLRGVKTVGVTAGASTPGWIIEGVLVKLKEMESRKSCVR